jgi:hypothetical protein
MLRLLNIVFLIAFLLSTLVQYNDPDSALWMTIYLSAALMCMAQHRQKLPAFVPMVFALISIIWIGLLLPSFINIVSWAEIVESISMKTEAVEEAREVGGLALVLLWSVVLAVHGLGKARRSGESSNA